MLNMAVFAEHSQNRNVRFLVADFVDNFPILSLFIQRAGGVKASPENAVKLLKKGELVCAFPEGTRGIGKLYSERYKLQEFGHGGVVRIARQTGAPVVPCAIIGAEEIYPVMWRFDELGKKMGLPFFPVTPTFPLFGLIGLIPLPSKWKIVFGKPIRYKPSRTPAEKLSIELKEKVQEMINKELIKRS
jgi:1-acyl-sn-glycerol-3-phosphate acyltransferase